MDPKQKQLILELLASEKLAVLSSISSTDPRQPTSALVAFAEEADDSLKLYFQTKNWTRKYSNISNNHNVSLSIGSDLSNLKTLQYQGITQLVESPRQIENVKKLFLQKESPTTPEYLAQEDVAIFKVTPTWIRYSDYSGDCPEVHEVSFS